jgi:hypothetical protein
MNLTGLHHMNMFSTAPRFPTWLPILRSSCLRTLLYSRALASFSIRIALDLECGYHRIVAKEMQIGTSLKHRPIHITIPQSKSPRHTTNVRPSCLFLS